MINKVFSNLRKNVNANSKEVLYQGITTLSFKIIGLILAYSVLIVITNHFGAEVFGRYSLTVTLSQLLIMIFTLGLPSAIVKLIANSKENSEIHLYDHLSKSLIITLVSGVFITIILYFCADFLAVFFFKDGDLSIYFKTLSFFIIPMMFHDVLTNYFRGKKEFIKYNLFTFILPYTLFFVAFLIVFKKDGEISTFLSLSVAITSVVVMEIFSLLNIKKGSINRRNGYSKILKLSFPMMFSSTLVFLLAWTDLFMLGYFKDSVEVGIYNAAFKIASFGYLIIIAINVVIGPKIAELYSQSNYADLKKMINQVTRLVIILTLPIILLIIVFRVELLGFFGPEFIVGSNALLLISIGVFFNAISGNVDQILNMTNHHVILRNITMICFFINVVLNFYFIPKYGINGSALTSLISNVLLNLLCIIYIRKELGFYTFL